MMISDHRVLVTANKSRFSGAPCPVLTLYIVYSLVYRGQWWSLVAVSLWPLPRLGTDWFWRPTFSRGCWCGGRVLTSLPPASHTSTTRQRSYFALHESAHILHCHTVHIPRQDKTLYLCLLSLCLFSSKPSS